jgi:hypothetical protein
MPLKIYLFAIMKIFEVAYLPPTLNFDASNATFFYQLLFVFITEKHVRFGILGHKVAEDGGT